MTVEFVASVDRSADLRAHRHRRRVRGRRRRRRWRSSCATTRTGAVPEAYYDRYAEESIDHLRAALAASAARRSDARGRADRHARHQGRRDRLRARSAGRARRRRRRDRLRASSASRGCAADVSRARRSPRAGGHALADVRARRLARRGRGADAARACARSSCACSPRAACTACCASAAPRARCSARAAMQALPVGVPKLLVSPCASGRRTLRRLRRRERRLRDALGRRHPRPQRDLAADLRQRRRGDGRAWSRDAGLGARARSASTASGSRCSARRRPA